MKPGQFGFLWVVCLALWAANCGNNTTSAPPVVTPEDAGTDAGTPDVDAGNPDAGDAGCIPQCEGKSCGEDKCGGQCGTCEDGWDCSVAGRCECTRETETKFCETHGVTCGALTALDKCGVEWTVDCDLCPLPETCHADLKACSCDAEDEVAFCAQVGECGTVTAFDNCNRSRTAQCACQGTDVCNPQTHHCEPCTPETDAAFCARLGKCGVVSGTDNCGGAKTNVDCVGCSPGYSCDASTNDCTRCPPMSKTQFCSTHNAQCGTLTAKGNCDADQTENCGTCANLHDTCDANHQCQPCVREAQTLFCQRNGKQCGPLTAPDNCGDSWTVDCGTCGSGAICDSSGSCQICTAESDADFCRRNNKWCGPFSGSDNCGAPKSVADCGACPGTRTCRADGRCDNGTKPPNDACDTPDILVFDANGHAQATGDTSIATADTLGNCTTATSANSAGPDVVYWLHLTSTADVYAVLNAPDFVNTSGLSPWPALYVRSSCSDQTTQVGTCDAGHSKATPNVVSLEAQPAGDYYIWVDGWASTSYDAGPFTLDVQLTVPPPPPPNDACLGAPVLQFTGNTATVSSYTRGATNDGTASCGTMDGPDVAYTLTLSSAASVMISVTAQQNSPKFKPGVYVADSCAMATEMGCAAASTAGGSANLAIKSLPAGSYPLFVDGLGATFGFFTMTVTLGAPVLNDSCAAPDLPEPIVVGGNGSVTVTSSTDFGASNGDTSCGSSSGKDLVYSFDVPAGAVKDVELLVAPLANSPFQPNIEIRTTCDSSTGQLGCKKASSANTPVHLFLKNQTSGTYYVWVDSSSSSASGPFSLTLSMSDPPAVPANDLCVGSGTAVPLDSTTRNTFTIQGLTIGAFNEATGSCATMDGADVYYPIQLTAPARLMAKVTRDAATPNWQPAVYILDNCPGSTPAPVQKGCGSSSTADTALASAPNLAAGFYYVAVDGLSQTEGSFTLQVEAFDPMDNDTCATARPIALAAGATVTVSGDTTGLVSDGSSTCGGSGPDVMYSLTLAARQDVEFTLTPISFTDQPLLHIRTTCSDSATELMCGIGTTKTSPVHFTIPGVAANTPLSVWVDGYYGSVPGAGAFTLTITALQPPPPPINDICQGGAQPVSTTPLDLVANTTATVSGSTIGAIGDSTGTCGGQGGDVAYSFTLAQEARVTAKVTATTSAQGYKPTVYVVDNCPGGTLTPVEKACNSSTSATTAATAQTKKLNANTTYFVIVDGTSATPGDFTLTVTASEAMDNDNCTAPKALQFTAVGSDLVAHIAGDTTGLADDVQTNLCGGYSPDAVYSFTVPTRKNAELILTPVNFVSGGQVNLSVRTACATTSSELACKTGANSTSAASLRIPGFLPGTTYYVWVDGYGGSYGTFTLDVMLRDPVPPINDACRNAEWLTIDSTLDSNVSVPGTTDDASNDSMGGCRSGATNPSGGDVVYAFSLSTEKKIDVTVTPTQGSNLQPVVYLLYGASCGTNTELACTAKSSVAAGALSLAFAPAGSYFLVVDSYSATAVGAFTLNVTTSAVPTSPPANDTCAPAGAPVAMTWDAANNKFTATGDTSSARDDYAGVCSGATSAQTGGDLVYTFALTALQALTITVTPDSTNGKALVPAVYLQTQCGSTAPADTVKCVAATSAGSTLTAGLSNLGAGSYYLIVDGAYGTRGQFSVSVAVSAPRPGDDCSSPIPVQLTAAVPAVHLTGDVSTSTGVLNDSTSLGCGGTDSGYDMVYQVSTVGMGTVRLFATLELSPNNDWPAMSLRSATGCSSTNVADEVACNRRSSRGPLTLSATVPEGVYYLWIDQVDSSSRDPFTLDISGMQQQPPPANDTCPGESLGAIALGTQVIKAGNALWANDNYQSPSCGSGVTTNGTDVVYSFTLTDTAQVTATLKSGATSPGITPAVYIQSSCGSAAASDQVACASNATTAVASAPMLSPGTYYIVVDGTTGSAGSYELTVAANSARYFPDSCAQAASMPPLTFVNGHASVFEDVRDAADDAIGSCYTTTGGKDLVYRIDTSGMGTVDFAATVQMLSSVYYPVIYLRSVCDTAGSQLACGYVSSTNTASIQYPNLAPGVYYLFVDGAGSSNNYPFWLSVDARPAPTGTPANDNCTAPSAPQPVAFDPVTRDAWFSGTTAGATAEATGTCGTMNGPDVVYSITLRHPAAIYAMVHRTGYPTSYTPGIYLASDCASVSSTTQIACGTHTNGAAKITTGTLPTGTYYLFVDGTSNSSGRFDLYVALLDPPPTGTCANALELNFDASGNASVIGSTEVSEATSTFTPSCTSSTSKEVVYAFTVPANTTKRLSAQVVPLEPAPINSSIYAFRGALALRPSCTAAASAELACAYTSSLVTPNAPLSLNSTNLDGGPGGTTYYLWVDTYSSTSYAGPFRLKASLKAPPPPPANDNCTGATPLGFDTNGVAHLPAAGNTLPPIDNAINDFAGATCGTSATGPDVVYYFTLGTDQKVVAKVTPSTTYAPTIYLRKGQAYCASANAADEVGCASTTTAGTSVTILKSVLTPDTYYLWVDSGTSNNSGTYTLDVTLLPPVYPPANDTCSGAVALTFDLNGVAHLPAAGGALPPIEAANNDFTGLSCGTSATGPDVVYYFVLAADQKVTAKVTPSTTYAPTIYLRKGPGNCGSTSAADEVGCATTTSGGTSVTITKNLLTTDTYYLWVDSGTSANTGTYSIDVTLAPPVYPPPNDTCATPTAIVAGTTYNGDTTLANADYFAGVTQAWSSTCSGSTYFPKGHDVVYSFQATSTGTVVATVTPNGWDALAWYSTAPCGTASACVAIKDAGGSSVAETLSMAVTAGETYYIYVSTYTTTVSSSYYGPFTLIVQ